GDGHADFGSWIYWRGRRRGNDWNAPRRGYYVRRFFDIDDGPDGQSGRQSSLHVRRKMESSDGVAHDVGCDATLGGATFTIVACVVQPRTRTESSVAFDAVRRQG